MDSYQKALYFNEDWALYVTKKFPVKKEDIEEVAIELIKLTHNCEYHNNFRIYPKNRLKEYIEIQKKGCCGSCDAKVVTSNGNEYLIGFNYGH